MSEEILEIRRILCAVDFSDISRHALEHAFAFAKWYESRVTALHVMTPVFAIEPPWLFAELAIRPRTQAERDAIRARVSDWLQTATTAGVQADALLEEGNPAQQILASAELLPADLIVIGTHGRGGYERFMLGSVAETVLRKAPCPVLTVPPRAESPAKLPYKRLLCPVDFSKPSLAALKFSFSIAKEADARLTILHVFEWSPDEDVPSSRFDAPEFRRAFETDARGRLESLVTDDVRVWCKPGIKIGYGKPYRQILEVAENEKTDLIVIGVRGRNAFDLTLLGSTTNQVVRRASCPVLTLRPKVA
jgi:nucleotide-binding universal stress UspA family protein